MLVRKFLLNKVVALGLCGLLLTQLAGCGTLLYPERRGQPVGEIDPAVVLFDGIGLFFFVVPGLVAFAIDFATGAIFLPGGQKSKEKLERMRKSLSGRFEERGPLLVLHVDPRRLTGQTITEVGRALTGGETPQLLVMRSGRAGGHWRGRPVPTIAQALF